MAQAMDRTSSDSSSVGSIHLPGSAPQPGLPFVRPSKLAVASVLEDNAPSDIVLELYKLRHRVSQLEAQLSLSNPSTNGTNGAPTPLPTDAAQTDPGLLAQRTLHATLPSSPLVTLPGTKPRSRPIPTTLPPGYSISSDPQHRFTYFRELYDILTTHPDIYWGQDRTLDSFARQMDRSWRCVYVLKEREPGDSGPPELAGFCRVVSDGEGFGYLADVVILPKHQKLGLASLMVKDVISNTSKGRECSTPSSSWKWFLWTRDAHRIYETVGFKQLPTNGRGMEYYPSAPAI
ncbi:hypothetical protein T439DRAFT_325916 [Meredithblackwellia eburnea MCA 4105]